MARILLSGVALLILLAASVTLGKNPGVTTTITQQGLTYAVSVGLVRVLSCTHLVF